MRIAVIGAGIIGVTTAYELGLDGHEVCVFERRGSVAAETSFANAGIVAPGYVTPWAGPGMPWKVLRGVMSRHSPVRVHADFDLGWAWQWWRACSAATYQRNRMRMQRLAYFSRERLEQVTTALRLEYERRRGYLVLLRTAGDLALVRPGLATLKALATRYDVLDASQCRMVEPGLSPLTTLHAGIHLPDDEVGNCRQFALLLRREAEGLGVRFQFATDVQVLLPGSPPRLTFQSRDADDSGSGSGAASAPATASPPRWHDTRPLGVPPLTQAFDAVVVCAALGAGELLKPLGIRLPLQPVYGYSVTAPLRHSDAHPDGGPLSALMDERFKVAISRLGTRIRVAGSAEIGGTPQIHHRGAVATLYKVLNDWFPGAADLAQAQHWKGARPMLPDGPPVLGASGSPGIWLNLGHGSSGWALSCGSARVLAHAIAGRAAPVDVEGLGIERLRV